MLYRSNGRQRDRPARPQGDQPSSDPADPDLWAAIGTLDARTRSALLLNVVDGYTQAEIARMLAVPEGTVTSWISRGRATLRQALDPAR